MAETPKTSEPAPTPTAGAPATPVTPLVPPRRSPGHRGADVKDTVAEMAAKAHEISLEAGSKMAAAMKDVINAAAGLSGFVIESARDLVQYMVRRGQMTQEEADKLIREVEAAMPKRKVAPIAHAPGKTATPGVSRDSATAHRPEPTHAATHYAPARLAHPVSKPVAKKVAPKTKVAMKKPAAKKAAPKKAAPKKAAPKKSPLKKKPAAKKTASKKAHRR